MSATAPVRTVGYLGPPGTFTEEALMTQADLGSAQLVPFASVGDVLAATEAEQVDVGFVPIENSIEGAVTQTVDALVFQHRLLIQREVVIPVRMQLVGPAGLELDEIDRVMAFPFAEAQCRAFLASKLATAEVVPAHSNAEAARRLAEDGAPRTAAISTTLAARLYGLEIIAADVEDHPDNSTRFVAVAREGIPAPTGHDRTSIACFQKVDVPGSLQSILGNFSARGIQLSKLESRPTKKGLGDYCFIIDLEGHVSDEVVADCLRNLHANLAELVFLGSYPAAGAHYEAGRREVQQAWERAEGWVESLQAQIRS
jgi:prephenate dehydratase